MATTVFWAWQSDLDAKVCRHFIREALDGALSKVAESLELEERPELDHDTKGIPGLAPIADSIFRKIDDADYFVADLTPIGKTGGAKYLSNPNVLIELGYAKKALGPERIILVWNNAFEGTLPEHLPFDLRHRRAPISYNLPIGTPSAGRKAALQELTDNLARALASGWVAKAESPDREVRWQASWPTDSSVWFDPSLPLQPSDSSGIDERHLRDGPRNYARMIPAIWPANVRNSQLEHSTPLNRYTGLDWGRIRGGLLTYAGNRDARIIRTASMQFKETGEVWGFGCDALDLEPRKQASGPFLLARWAQFFARHELQITRQGGAGPFHVRLGVNDLGGAQWVSLNWRGGGPICSEDSFSYEFVYEGGETLRPHLLDVWNGFVDLFGFEPNGIEELDGIIERGG